MNKNIWGDFQICIGVPLIVQWQKIHIRIQNSIHSELLFNSYYLPRFFQEKNLEQKNL